jgi:hypothetical protein
LLCLGVEWFGWAIGCLDVACHFVSKLFEERGPGGQRCYVFWRGC